MKIAISTLVTTAAWTAELVAIAYSPGIHSTPGIWLMLIGLPGVAVATLMASLSDYAQNDALGYLIMFLGNWFFLWGVVQGFVSLKRKLSK
jgi:hypothetical protein